MNDRADHSFGAAAGPRVRPARVDPDRPAALQPVYVWDLVVRSTHWLIALSIITLALTGIYIARPFLESAGPAHQRFLMGGIKVVHYYASIVFTVSVAARVVWMFLGPRQSSWRQFIPVQRKRRRDMVGTFLFYTFVRPKPPPSVGHNPLAGATYAVVFLLYLVMILTGFALYSAHAYTSYMRVWEFLLPIFGGAQGARWIHHVVMWLLLGFAVHHVFSALLVARVEKNGTLDSIFSGYKYLPSEHANDNK